MNEIGTGVGTKYYFFGNSSSPRYVHVVAESAAGLFSHLSFGTIEKAGTFTGGGYLSSSSVSTGTGNYRAPFGGKGSNSGTSGGTSWIYVPGLIGASGGGWNRNFGSLAYSNSNALSFTDALWLPGIDAATQRTALAPIICLSFNNATSTAVDRSQIIGRVQGVRSLSMRTRDPGSSLTFGSDTWRVFPWRAKSDAGGDNISAIYSYDSTAPFNSGLCGLAYLEFA